MFRFELVMIINYFHLSSFETKADCCSFTVLFYLLLVAAVLMMGRYHRHVYVTPQKVN